MLKRLARRSAAAALIVACVLGSRASEAQPIIIDDFSSNQPLLFANGVNTQVSNLGTGGGILGSERDNAVEWVSGSIVRSDFVGGDYNFQSFSSTEGRGTLVWDGADGLPAASDIDYIGLGSVDLTTGGSVDALKLATVTASNSPRVDVEVYSDAINWSVYTVAALGSITTPTDLVIPFADFTVASGAGADFANVGAIVLRTEGIGVVLNVEQVQAEPMVTVTMTDSLQVDLGGDGVPSDGDTIRYEVIIDNPPDRLSAAARNVQFDVAPDPNSTLRDMEVITTQGVVTTGNMSGDTVVSVNVGDIADGVPVTITFDVVLDDPIADGVTALSVQGVLRSDSLTSLPTDDPDDTTSTVARTVTTLYHCGNGIVDAPLSEDCDDTGESATCDADCTVVTCGDGTTNATAGEECDDMGESADCDADCTDAVCGDGTVNGTADEDCDDMGESATCDTDCTTAVCGDGTVNTLANETCDDMGESADCDDDCTTAVCGDSHLNSTAGEDCDDGGDSEDCDADCSDADCGDGYFNDQADEECDHAGESATCDADCTMPICGDGTWNQTAGEECDDAMTLTLGPDQCGPDGDCQGLLRESPTCDVDCTIAMCGDGTLNTQANEECDDAGESADCDADCTDVDCGDMTVNMTAGEECDDGVETDTCDVDCTMAMCGDGTLNTAAGESCDDGMETDTCDIDCTMAMCRDGTLNMTAGEECDDGTETMDCDLDCTMAMCGDGTVNTTAGELCDDMGESGTCDRDCTPAECGDDMVNPTAGEECDDGGRSEDCDDDCTRSECGDGTLNPDAGEVCDDAGESRTCDDDCTVPECGDRVVNEAADEECDDGEESAECDVDCTVAECGDGVVNQAAGEECDDGNREDGDACPSTCGQRLPGDDFTIAGAGCSATGQPDAPWWLMMLFVLGLLGRARWCGNDR